MAIKRRRPRVVWLPNSLDNRLGVTGQVQFGEQSSILAFSLDATGPAGQQTVGVVPVVHDAGDSPAFAPASLADLVSSQYRLRRIVGKIFVACHQSEVADALQPGRFIVTAGFIVLRTDSVGNTLAINQLYSPARIDTYDSPWIWRRSWLVSDFTTALQEQNGWAGPEGNWQQGSAVDGPHVDQKTARVIGEDERLFLVVTATSLSTTQNDGVACRIDVFADLRVLASMRSSQGNRNNSSR